MLLTNLLLACGLSTAVGSGLALKENSNYLHHEKPQEQLHLDNKKNINYNDPDEIITLTYDDLVNGVFDALNDFLVLTNSILESENYFPQLDVMGSQFEEGYIDDESMVLIYRLSLDLDESDNGYGYYLTFNALGGNKWTYGIETYVGGDSGGIDFSFDFPSNASYDFSFYSNDLYEYYRDNLLTYPSSTTQEVFEVVGDTTTGFVGVLTSAFAGMTSLIYNNGEFTILGVLLLIATGVSLVYWIFRLIRGVTSGVAR